MLMILSLFSIYKYINYYVTLNYIYSVCIHIFIHHTKTFLTLYNIATVSLSLVSSESLYIFEVALIFHCIPDARVDLIMQTLICSS